MTIRTHLAERLREGRQLARQAHRDQEQSKLGTLRAGTSGMMSGDGDVAGGCHRKAHLRSLGIEIEVPDDSRLIMFQMGTANEDLIYADLLHTKAEDEIILREEEIPIQWLTSNGTKVTGRPDMVVCKAGDPPTPLFGVEIKSIASVWTSKEVLGSAQPKLEHLIQSGHYSWKLGVPFRLLYKQYGIQEIPFWKGQGNKPGWGQNLFPKKGEVNSEHIDYEKGRIQPFEIVYELDWAKGFLSYRREGSQEKAVRTMVSSADIERFYEFVSRMGEKQELGPRPLTIDAAGQEKNYSNCGYCPLKETCDRFEKKGYTAWLQAVQQTVNGK